MPAPPCCGSTTGRRGCLRPPAFLGAWRRRTCNWCAEGLHTTTDRQGVVYATGRERREVRLGNDPFLAEDRAFLEAVRRNAPGLLVCDYAEALLTHRLCFDVAEAAR